MDQNVLDRAVQIATRAAMHGTPVERIIWIPPQSASQDSLGSFAIQYAPPMSGSLTPCWEK